MQIEITKIPQALAMARAELAHLVREAAADEEPAVAFRLRQIAAVFETGQTEDLSEDDR